MLRVQMLKVEAGPGFKWMSPESKIKKKREHDFG